MQITRIKQVPTTTYQPITVSQMAMNPAAVALKLIRNGQRNRIQAMGLSDAGMQQTAATAGVVGIALGVVVLVAYGALNYQIGKAMAPNKQAEGNWAWTAVPVGILTGSLGLGIMAINANGRK